ncbi:hypothetical protein ACSBR1_015233 [Camellia fascicularis]
MYITTYLSTALRRVSRTKFLSSSPSLSTAAASCSSSRAHSSPSITNQCRSFNFSSAFRSVPQWSHSVDWKSPATSERAFKGILTGLPKPEVTTKNVEKIIDWKNTSPKQVEIPFEPARVLLQVPVDLVTDHSVQVDVARSENVVQANKKLEFQRNKGRFAFLKWGSNAFQNMLVVPVGSGFVHQVNLEYLGRVVFNIDGMLYPDSVVGTDSHATMINGLVVAGWGLGGIETEAAMLGQVNNVIEVMEL